MEKQNWLGCFGQFLLTLAAGEDLVSKNPVWILTLHTIYSQWDYNLK